MVISPFEVAAILVKCLENGFDVSKLSKCAFQIYQEHGLELAPEMDQVLLMLMLMLMAMEEGESFELSDLELLGLIVNLKEIR